MMHNANASKDITGILAHSSCLLSQLTLLKLLQAYEAVLKKHNISASEDTYYYRLLLKLSLEPSPDWWGKFHRECEQNAR